MAYVIAVDVGTSRTAAATARLAPHGNLTVAPFALGRHVESMPSAAFVGSGELLWGDAAERRGLTQPERLIREFKRRVGDEVPIVAGDQAFAPEQLYARLVAWVVGTVQEREGETASAICVTVPAGWSGYRTGLVTEALEREGLRDVEIMSEPEAAARHYEREKPIAPGHALAVYDFGGGTFDAVILRKNDDGGLEVAGHPLGIDDLGGADFDDLMLRHTVALAGFSAPQLAVDPRSRMALSALRRECIDAKESLSFDSEVSIPVLLGERDTTVRVTRSEFEAMIDAALSRTADVLADALIASGADAERVDAILLTGGSSRIPRVAERLSERFDRPIAVDADPKAIIALGGAGAVARDRLPYLQPALEPAAAGVDARDAEVVELGLPAPAHYTRARRVWFGRGSAAALSGVGAVVLAGAMVALSASALGDTATGEPFPADASNAELVSSALPWPWGAAPAAAAAGSAETAPAIPDVPAPVAEAVSDPTPKAVAPRQRGVTSKIPSGTSRAAQPRATSPAAAAPTARTAPSPSSRPVAQTPEAPRVEPAPVADPAPSPLPAPDPTSEPQPEPEPQPDPVPDPTPDPVPDPTPDPEPDPDPAPDPVPEQPADPAPEPEPVPVPTTE